MRKIQKNVFIKLNPKKETVCPRNLRGHDLSPVPENKEKIAR